MLQFPPWKVLTVLAVMAWGMLMALPNVVNPALLPGFLPKDRVNLGLDLRGGVYLLMEIEAEDVVNNRLEIFARDLQSAFGPRDGQGRIGFRPDQPRAGALTVRLTQPDASGNFRIDEALRRMEAINPTVPGGLAGTKMFAFARAGEDSIRVTVPGSAEEALMADALQKTMTIVRRRVDPDGVAEIEITPQGRSRIILEAPGEPDPERLKNLLSRDGKMTFNLVEDSPTEILAAQRGVVKPGFRLLDGPETGPILVRVIPEIVGSDIATATQAFGEGNAPEINFRLNTAGARKFFETTRANVNRRFAIVLDDVVMSAPRINEPIPGGNVRITGTFTITEAQDLAAIIAAGEMPAKLNFLDQRVVSSTLGEDSVRAGYLAAIVGLTLVGVFMVVAYGIHGIFAVMSLAANIVLIFAALSLMNATLTLPGIAGIVLTIGMAVDANVLVFERIREEQRAGRSPWTAVQAGYERALITILDSNLTTLFAAAILYALGSGPVRGFAVTLAFGILTSVFTAFVFTRMLTVFWMKAARPKKLWA